jgi:alkylation response protein AidB-like acyl-CoA dehydrogenase
LAASHAVQEKTARAEIRLYAARLLLFDAARRTVAADGEGGDDLSSPIRLASAIVGEDATAAVDTAYTLAGTTSLYATSRIERCFRDVHSVTKHQLGEPGGRMRGVQPVPVRDDLWISGP